MTDLKDMTSSGNNNSGKQAYDINLLNMIESRIMEIFQIEDECKRKLPKLFHQRVPRFMRRRAASHNAKRIPKKFRPTAPNSEFGSKSRTKLLKYRHRLRLRKNKRILKRHARHSFNDPFKCLLHKWFAKRFRMCHDGSLVYVPLSNNTKNQRNLCRQARFGCCYISYAHLIPVQVTLASPTNDPDLYDDQIKNLNRLTKASTGFTFAAKALRNGRYEVVVHLFKFSDESSEGSQGYLCKALTSISLKKGRACLTLWVPRSRYQLLCNYLEMTSRDSSKQFEITKIYPRDWTRIRLIGPRAREEVLKLVVDRNVEHTLAIEDTDTKLSTKSTSIGRFVEGDAANFTYFKSKPQTVDIVFKKGSGRMLWYQLIKNKAHLVGGLNNIPCLLKDGCFSLFPESILIDEKGNDC